MMDIFVSHSVSPAFSLSLHQAVFLRIPWNFEIFLCRLDQVWRMVLLLYRFIALRISAIGLKFSEMMHSTIKQIHTVNGYAQLIFAHSTELSNFSW